MSVKLQFELRKYFSSKNVHPLSARNTGQDRRRPNKSKGTVFLQSAIQTQIQAGLSRISVCSGITNMRTQCSGVKGEIRIFGLQTSHILTKPALGRLEELKNKIDIETLKFCHERFHED